MTERPTYAKSTCCILGCPRWSRKYDSRTEWICYRHWRLIPGRCRRALTRAWTLLRDFQVRYGRLSPVPPAELQRWRRVSGVSERLWDHAKRRVILQEAGL